MDSNLKSRLKRIRDTGSQVPGKEQQKTCIIRDGGADLSSWPLWKEAGYKVLKRVIKLEPPFTVPDIFPRALAVLVPDLLTPGRLPSPEELIFFDLETTGLSGGAGTLAFLAAFGRFSAARSSEASVNNSSLYGSSGSFQRNLEITQYLLLDFPGEGEFIEQAAAEFCVKKGNNDARHDKRGTVNGNTGKGEAIDEKADDGALPWVLSFNGKCFDSQILRNRCLMNGLKAPLYFHADLLHPARRLWKRLLPDCSQSTIETSILGLSREGDISGALAPDIWFSFLRDGENSNLLKICNHNVLDIAGLAALFLAMGDIVMDPYMGQEKIRFDEEELAVIWMRALKKAPMFFGDSEKETGECLLQRAAKKGYPRASFFLALDLIKSGRNKEGTSLLIKLAECDSGLSASLRAAALKSLAIDAEWRLKDFSLALEYVLSALEIPEIKGSARYDMEMRQKRLNGKL